MRPQSAPQCGLPHQIGVAEMTTNLEQQFFVFHTSKQKPYRIWLEKNKQKKNKSLTEIYEENKLAGFTDLAAQLPLSPAGSWASLTWTYNFLFTTDASWDCSRWRRRSRNRTRTVPEGDPPSRLLWTSWKDAATLWTWLLPSHTRTRSLACLTTSEYCDGSNDIIPHSNWSIL